MSLTKLTANLNNISSLPDKPTLQSDELKALFDEAGNVIKEYLNEVLTDEVEKLVSDTARTTKTTVENTLDSDSIANALSSAQGKVLKTLIDNLNTNKQKNISISSEEPTGGTSGDIHIQYFD
jgi:Mg/Co/Ni transporter MgtE